MVNADTEAPVDEHNHALATLRYSPQPPGSGADGDEDSTGDDDQDGEGQAAASPDDGRMRGGRERAGRGERWWRMSGCGWRWIRANGTPAGLQREYRWRLR
jgi:hypothetical protein